MNYMIYSLEELEEKTSLKNKFTAIVATCQSPIISLMWSILSIYLRSSSDFLEHIIVSINGPDKRTGDPSLQNKKQEFLEELRDLTYDGKSMPLTINRVWSRIGHTQALESVIPWVHTEFYAIAHDDILMLNNDWHQNVLEDFKDDKLAFIYNPPLLNSGVYANTYKGKNKLAMPHLNSSFVLCKKSILNSLNARWYGYHVEEKIQFFDRILGEKTLSTTDTFEFNDYHFDKNHIVSDQEISPEIMHPQTARLHRSCVDDIINNQFDYYNVDVGGYIYHQLNEKGYKFKSLENDSIYHFVSGSWNLQTFQNGVARGYYLITEFENLLKTTDRIPGVYELYKKYAS